MNIFIDKKKSGIIAIFCCILWGSAFPALKISYTELGLAASDFSGKIVFAGIRFLIASLILFFISKTVLKIDMRLKFSEFKKLFLLGLFNTALMYFFFYNGLANTTGIKASILQSIGTFCVVIASHFAFKDDKINSNKIIGLILGFAGIAVINITRGFGGNTFTFIGEGFMILAAVSGTIGTITAKKLTDIHPFKTTAWQMLFGSLILLFVGMPNITIESYHYSMITGGLLVYTSLLSAAAFSLWFMLLKYNKASEITLFKFIVPIAGSIFSAMILPGENLTSNVLFGLMLVCVGLLVVNLDKKLLSNRRLTSMNYRIKKLLKS